MLCIYSAKRIIYPFILTQLSLSMNIALAATDLTPNIHHRPLNQLKSVHLSSMGTIAPGAGYSHDTQQVPNNICYNIEKTSTTGQQGVINLNTAVSFSDLEKQLHTKVSASSGFGMFSASAEAEYFRSMRDLDYSLSLNYYEYLHNTVMMQLHLGDDPLDILTPNGKYIYTKTKEYFGINCGDDFISSYQQGSLLLMGINIRFASHLDKQQFKASAGASFGNIISASAEIQKITKQYNMKGSVIIQAFQKGGDPEELSKILSKDSSGVYYTLSCDLQHMDNCVQAASGLLNYAVNIYPQQISFTDPSKKDSLVPLGIGFMTHDPIAEYKLDPPPSLVTRQVIEDRNYLADALLENQYYQQKLDELLHGYPVPLASDNVVKTAEKLYKQATSNIDLIMKPSNPADGSLKCYSHPTLCHQTRQSIQEHLKPIPPNFEFLDDIAKTVSLTNFNFWYPTNKTQFFAWYPGEGRWIEGNMQITDTAINVNSLFKVIILKVGPVQLPVSSSFQGILARKDNIYTGTICPINVASRIRHLYCEQVTATLSPNPFYFSAYKTDNDSQV